MKVRILAAAVLATMFACSLEVSAGRGGGAAAPVLVGVETDQIPGYYRGFSAYDTGSIDPTTVVKSTFGGFLPADGSATYTNGTFVSHMDEVGSLVVIGSKLYFAEKFNYDGGIGMKVSCINLDGTGYTQLASLGTDVNYRRIGNLAQGPDGGLYVAVGKEGIFKVDTTTGAMTQRVVNGGEEQRLAFDGSGNMYVCSDTGGNAVNKYDAATGALITANWATGLGALPNDMLVTGGKLVASVTGFNGNGGYWSVDTTAGGAFTKFHDPLDGSYWAGYMAVNPVDGKIWTGRDFDNKYFSFNLDGSDTNTFGPFGPAEGGDYVKPYGGIAFLPVPEPASMLLLGLGSVALLRRRK